METDKPKFVQNNDAIVTFSDAAIWCEELLQTRAAVLYTQLIEEEPAVAAVSKHVAACMLRQAINMGVPTPLALKLAKSVAQCGLVAAELTRRGYRKFIADEGAPDSDGDANPDAKETPHE